MTELINDKKRKSLAVLLLAAGQSSRLGQAKQSILYQGQSLLNKQLLLAQTVSDDVYCVLGYQAEHFVSLLKDHSVNIVTNDNWSSGMASSIIKGIKALPATVDAVMIILVDQWQLQSSDLQLLKKIWQNNLKDMPSKIVLAGHKNNIGPPVIFPRSYFTELLQLKGQQGAKPILKKYKQNLHLVTMASAFVDLDTPEQLKKLYQQEKQEASL